MQRRIVRADVPNPVDMHVGYRVRLRRTMLGMSQTQLAEAIGLTYQQVQKYEQGMNRIGASTLFSLSNILDVPVSYFFDNAPLKRVDAERTARRRKTGLHAPKIPLDPMIKRETLEMVRAYYRIEHRLVRRKIYELIQATAKGSSPRDSTAIDE